MATVHLTDRARILLHHRSLTVPNGPEIVAQAPPGVNDYDYLRAFISAILTPDLPKAFYVNLVLLAILLLVGLVGSVAVIVWPFRQGRDSVQKNLWIIKRRYVSQYQRPYIVPNFILSLSVSFAIHAIWSQIYIWTNYKSYQNLNDSIERQRKTRLFLWYGMIFIPSYVGLWLLAFSGIYAAWFASSPGTTLPGLKHKFLRPEVVNAVCWGVPVLVILTTSAAAGAEADYHEKLLSSSVSFVTNLKTAAIDWDAEQKIGTDLTVKLTQQSNTFQNQAEAFFAAFAACIGLWAFWLFVACLLFLGSMATLLHVVRLRIRSAGGRGVSLRDLTKGTTFGGGSLDGGLEDGNGHDGLTPVPTAARKNRDTRRALRSSTVSWKRFSVLGPAGAGFEPEPRSAFDDEEEEEQHHNVTGTANGSAGAVRGETSEVVALRRTFWNTLVHFSLLIFFTLVMLATALWTAGNLAEIEFKPSLRSSTILLGIWPMAIAGTAGILLLLLRMVTTQRIVLDGRPMRPLSGAATAPAHLSSQVGNEADEYDENDLEAHARQGYQDDPPNEGDRLKPSPEMDANEGTFALGDDEPEELEEGQRESPEALLTGRQFNSPRLNRGSPSSRSSPRLDRGSPSSRRIPVPPLHPLDSPEAEKSDGQNRRPPEDPFADDAKPATVSVDATALGLARGPEKKDEPQLIEVPRAERGLYGGLVEADDTMEFHDAVDFGYRDR